MQFTVNDQSCEAYLNVRRSLLDFLRDHLQLAGTKKGRSWQILARLQPNWLLRLSSSNLFRDISLRASDQFQKTNRA